MQDEEVKAEAPPEITLGPPDTERPFGPEAYERAHPELAPVVEAPPPDAPPPAPEPVACHPTAAGQTCAGCGYNSDDPKYREAVHTRIV